MGKTEATVILNRASGRREEASEARIVAGFHKAGTTARVIVLQEGEDPADASRTAAANGDLVVAAGGDGTVGAVAAVLAGTPAVLGVLPIGTLNHFAKDLKIPTGLDRAISTIASGRVVSIDVGRVNDRVFVNNASIGMYPSVVQAREEFRRAGHAKWPAMALAIGAMLRRYRGIVVRITADGREAVWRTPFVFVGNNEYMLEGPQLGSRAALTGGRLFAYLTPRVRTRQLPMLFVRALLERPGADDAFEVVATSELTVETLTDTHIRVALDGETVTMNTPLNFHSWPGALRVLVPPD